MENPTDEKSYPVIKCTECEGTGYESYICRHCGYDMGHDFDLDPNSVNSYGPDDACPSCRHNDALPICSECQGDGKREMNFDEYQTFVNNMKYGHHEKL